MADTAVIINEFGEIGLDHQLLEAAKDEPVVMSSGCLCCTVRSDLVDTMRGLWLKRVRGTIPQFKRVVIETTGLADPAPILHTLMEDPVIQAYYSLDGVIATVDALNGEWQLDAQMESVKQAAVADRMVITKSDLTDPETVNKLEAELRETGAEQARIETSLGETRVELEEQERRARTMRAEREELEREVQLAREKLDSVDSGIASAKEELSQSSARLDSLKDLVAARAHFASGARLLLAMGEARGLRLERPSARDAHPALPRVPLAGVGLRTAGCPRRRARARGTRRT